MSRREMYDEGLPWGSSKRKSDKYAKNGEEMMDILVDDIDRYEQLLFQDRLHWFGKRLTCSCYVKFSHNVTFYEKIQISSFCIKPKQLMKNKLKIG
jgi:hypothetical protein